VSQHGPAKGKIKCSYQCVGSGSGFNQVNGSGSRRAKMTHKTEKVKKFYQVLNVLFKSKLWIRIRIAIQPKMLDPDQYPESIIPDLKHWFTQT
jgi:hypothetical protein